MSTAKRTIHAPSGVGGAAGLRRGAYAPCALALAEAAVRGDPAHRLRRRALLDPALTQSLLDHAELRGGSRTGVAGAAHAVALLGPRRLRLWALAAPAALAVEEGYRVPAQAADWRHCLQVALACRRWACDTSQADSMAAYEAGLLTAGGYAVPGLPEALARRVDEAVEAARGEEPERNVARLERGLGKATDERWRQCLSRAAEILSEAECEASDSAFWIGEVGTLLARAGLGLHEGRARETLLTEIVVRLGFERAWLLEAEGGAATIEMLVSEGGRVRAQEEREVAAALPHPRSVPHGFVRRGTGDHGCDRLLEGIGADEALLLPLGTDGSRLLGADMGDSGAALPHLTLDALELLREGASWAVAHVHRFALALDEARTDPLTGVPNRRAVLKRLAEAVDDARCTGRPLGVVLFDADHFKRVNDTCGHQKGDEVLRSLGAMLRDSVRGWDVVGRYGGEEFLAVLPGADLERARAMAERVRMAVEEESGARRRAGHPGQITLSCGVAQWNGKESVDELLFAADAALYRAKAAGRNCTETR